MATHHNPMADASWYPDSGASHHVTSDLANLNLTAAEYMALIRFVLVMVLGYPLNILEMQTFPHLILIFIYVMFCMFHISKKKKFTFSPSIHQIN
jgi:hypothetical protein